MFRSHQLVLTGIVILGAAGPLAAQTVRRVAELPKASNTAADRNTGTATAAEVTALADRSAEAQAYMANGRVTEARRALRDIRTAQERAGIYPAVTLRRLAEAEFALDRPLAAAAVLEELAAAAAVAIDPNTEVLALVDASVLYVQAGQAVRVRALAPRVRQLLASPALADETRRQVEVHGYRP